MLRRFSYRVTIVASVAFSWSVDMPWASTGTGVTMADGPVARPGVGGCGTWATGAAATGAALPGVQEEPTDAMALATVSSWHISATAAAW
jgi:hypothetical protein